MVAVVLTAGPEMTKKSVNLFLNHPEFCIPKFAKEATMVVALDKMLGLLGFAGQPPQYP